jgi:hypothetical protein
MVSSYERYLLRVAHGGLRHVNQGPARAHVDPWTPEGPHAPKRSHASNCGETTKTIKIRITSYCLVSVSEDSQSF